jgi:transitional endoplasmic reticulum ATPase
VIAATNCPWALDGALLRPGRFNEKIYIPLPDYDARLFILGNNLKKCTLADDADIKNIAAKLDGCNGADVVEFCEKVKMTLIKKEINKTANPIITQSDIYDILKNTNSSVLKDDLNKMKDYIKS